MKKIFRFLTGLVLLASIHQAAAQGTTAFTYQGQLHDNGTNANGAYTMIFKLYDAVTNGNQIGSAITNTETLANGLFTVNLDFGTVFGGAATWLDITITNGGMTQILSPRVQILPAPYALFAANAATAVSPGTNSTLVSAAESNMRIVRGVVLEDGSAYAGTGFTSSLTSPGHYHVTFNPAFSGTPIIALGGILQGNGAFASVDEMTAPQSASGFNVASTAYTNFFGGTVNTNHCSFNFIAIGPK